ncbi:Disease resistance protein RPM1 [Camellia lanceoleosa]|uniref:Disease resistance protein RPM1 n=1 Tax=Camellia lanceoleosa TaxID=1840588 RepID=A0ACC0GVN3_9ERIC|nr:Disease resistance protein RPM1 [Camellia lanceoleosa]
MAERAVSSVIQYLAPLLADEVKLLKGVRKEIVSIKAELERIHSFLEDAESRAETGDKGVKIWVKQVRQVAYRIQDAIDENILLVLPKQPGLFGSLSKVTRTITKLKPRHQIASQIQDIKNTIREIKEGADRYAFSTSSSTEHTSTSTSTKDMWRDPRLASLFIGDDEVVGIESPKSELISRLVDKNQSQRAVISLVGMGGIGKTTLAKKVYDSQEMAAHFDCKAWITVSQSYKPEELLKTMIEQLSGKDVPTLPNEGTDSLIAKVRGYLYEKKYVIVFDDVWQIDFWGSIRHALPQNSKGSRVIITTRSEQVAAFCKESSVDHVHELQALSEEKAWELFCMKAFQLDFGGHCPLENRESGGEVVLVGRENLEEEEEEEEEEADQSMESEAVSRLDLMADLRHDINVLLMNLLHLEAITRTSKKLPKF